MSHNFRDEPVYICALKTVLISRSSVFEAMFTGKLADNREVIPVTDVEPEAFRQMIR